MQNEISPDHILQIGFGFWPAKTLLSAVERGDLPEAARCQARSVAMIDVINRCGGFAAQKAIMGFIGHPCGPPRLPQRSLGDEQTAQLRRELDAIGFFDWGRSQRRDSA